MKFFWILFLLFALKVSAVDVEYISGSISYAYISGSCPSSTKFQISVKLCTKDNKTKGDSVLIYFGDGVRGYAKRTDSLLQGNHCITSTYKIFHTYPSCGEYIIDYLDTLNGQHNNNFETGNDHEKFYIFSQIYLASFLSPTSSYKQLTSPVGTILKNLPFSFNPALSTNNALIYDSIIYTLYSKATAPCSIYIPAGVSINRYSGEIQWLNPDTVGKYAFTIDSKMYRGTNKITTSQQYYKFDVVNRTPSSRMDSINRVPVNANNFKEIYYTAGNTYSFSAVYTDVSADSVKLFIYPIDFFDTAPIINVTQNSIRKHTLTFSWSPLTADERLYPYSFVLNSRSYYPNDSVANSYQTVSFRSSRINAIESRLLTSVLLYPNPASSTIFIEDKQNELQNSTIEITSSIGQSVLQFPFSSSIDVSTLPAGCYFIAITTPQKSVLHTKFIKE